MTYNDLINNKSLLLDYTFDKIDAHKRAQIREVVKNHPLLSKMIEDLKEIASISSLNNDDLKHFLLKMEQDIIEGARK